MSQATETAASRYERTEDGTVIIDVTATHAGDLYHRLDRTAPYAVRDLDPLLVDFLREAVSEIGTHPFLIRFQLDEEPDDETKDRIRKSVVSYFDHAQQLEKREQARLIRKSVTLVVGGLIFLIIAVWVRQPSEEDLSVGGQFLVQGLMVTAWMSAWEGMSSFILEWPPLRKDARRYGRIARASVVFAQPTRASGQRRLESSITSPIATTKLTFSG